jgi:hypothetical protein
MKNINPFETVIFHWSHRCETEAQCLVRMYAPMPSEIVFVTSELRRNRHENDTGYGKINGLGSDFVNLANKIWKYYFRYPQVSSCWEEWESGNSKSLNVTWLQHYGSFSDWDSDGLDSFTKILLKFEREKGFFNPGTSERYPDEARLETKQVEELSNSLYLENIESILGRKDLKVKALDESRNPNQVPSGDVNGLFQVGRRVKLVQKNLKDLVAKTLHPTR